MLVSRENVILARRAFVNEGHCTGKPKMWVRHKTNFYRILHPVFPAAIDVNKLNGEAINSRDRFYEVCSSENPNEIGVGG